MERNMRFLQLCFLLFGANTVRSTEITLNVEVEYRQKELQKRHNYNISCSITDIKEHLKDRKKIHLLNIS